MYKKHATFVAMYWQANPKNSDNSLQNTFQEIKHTHICVSKSHKQKENVFGLVELLVDDHFTPEQRFIY
jgi:hypothetical protein